MMLQVEFQKVEQDMVDIRVHLWSAIVAQRATETKLDLQISASDYGDPIQTLNDLVERQRLEVVFLDASIVNPRMLFEHNCAGLS